MPGLTELEVLKEIRKEDKVVKFIILTFNSLDYFKKAALEAGTDYSFNKADAFKNFQS